MAKYYQGKFKPRNPKKYMGNPANIIYRSSWELKLMVWLDTHSKITQWGSEEIVIPYRNPIDGKVHRYFTDFVVKQKDKQGKIKTSLIEVKPKIQTRPPVSATTKKGKPTKKFIKEVMTWGMNEAKWKAAQEFCLDRGWEFKIFTEDHLGIHK